MVISLLWMDLLVHLFRDNFADLYEENPEWRRTIEEMVLVPTFVGDTLMFPVDPQGKEGPTLDQLLRN